MRSGFTFVMAAATVFGLAACTDYDSATNLNPDGPPMVRQIRMKESYTEPGQTTLSTRRVFGFGTHPAALDIEEHAVTSASLSGQAFRVIMDELLVGNNLEEIGCRANVDGDTYSRVPVGATPDDVARCSTAQDVLPSTCKGKFAMCICQNEAGCAVGTTTIPKDAPVGVDDKNQDGAADDTRFIQDAVGVQCGNIKVPIDLNMSYWNPSGNQEPPAMGGFEALGPAIVLVPTNGLPSNIDCALTFAEDVVDKQGIRVCAPPNGDVTQTCNPGDTSLAKFKTEPMTVAPASFTNNQTGVSRTDPAIFIANTNLDPSSTSAVTITSGGNPFTNFTVTITMGKVINVTPTGTGFAANTTYTITIGTGVKDTFGQPLPAPLTITFTTGA